MVYLLCMQTCLGLLMLLLVLVSTAFTVVYHTSINATIRFDRKETNTEFINTRRSFRPVRTPQTRAEAPRTLNSLHDKNGTIRDFSSRHRIHIG